MKSQIKDKGGWRPWLRVIRLPNLFTVPGDVLVGVTIAAMNLPVDPSRLLAALTASLCLYTAGLIMNDLVDEGTDRRERPTRPIASGAISRASARGVIAFLLGFALAVLGVRGIALLAAGALIGGLTFAYNIWAKRSRLAGSIVMGMCRAANVLLGVVAVSPTAVQATGVHAVVLLWFCFIAAVSWLAAREMKATAYGFERWLPLGLVIIGGGVLVYLSDLHEEQAMFRFGFCFFFALILCYQAGLGFGIHPQVRMPSGRIRKQDTGRIYPQSIGLLLSALIPVQAGVLILHANKPWMLLAALLTLFCWPLNRLCARYISSS